MIIQIAIDLGIEVVGIIYSIAKIESLDKHYYKNAKIIFDDAIKAVDSAKQNNLSLVCCSFYLYREIRKELN